MKNIVWPILYPVLHWHIDKKLHKKRSREETRALRKPQGFKVCFYFLVLRTHIFWTGFFRFFAAYCAGLASMAGPRSWATSWAELRASISASRETSLRATYIPESGLLLSVYAYWSSWGYSGGKKIPPSGPRSNSVVVARKEGKRTGKGEAARGGRKSFLVAEKIILKAERW